jgi:hypothetical protein
VDARKNSKPFFSHEDIVLFCNDVFTVMEVLGHEYSPVQWRLFIDSSKVSLKLVLLHNGNRFPSVSLAHAANTKESYESMKLLSGKVKYDEFKWNVVTSKCGAVTRNATRVHKILLFPVQVGQPGQEESLYK